MGEKAQELQPETISEENSESKKKSSFFRQYKWWWQMIIYSIFVVGGPSAGTLLTRVYYEKGGKSNWMATLVQVCGFPAMIPFQFYYKNPNTKPDTKTKTNTIALTSFYVAIGVFLAVDCMLYSVGIRYLPITTYTLLCATQLGFTALFSFFLNNQKFTPFIINSLVLLTISSTLLVFQTGGGGAAVSERKYAIGIICTVAAAAGYGMILSLTQLAFKKLIKKETIRAIIGMSVYQNVVATLVIMIGLFASGDWRKLTAEMEGYRLGKVSYVMNLFWTAISWQVFTVGCTGLIFMISSLFSNVICFLGIPVAPVMAAIFLGERLTGLKAVAMLLAMWGFVSYMYQHYLDGLEMKRREKE